jgi:putative polyhydroxyalkanoate system protein
VADIDIRRTHQLGLSGAREVAERMAEHLGRKFDLRGAWKENTLEFQRPGVSGFLAVTGEEVHLCVSLGFMLKAMRGSIERAVVDELDQLFHR